MKTDTKYLHLRGQFLPGSPGKAQRNGDWSIMAARRLRFTLLDYPPNYPDLAPQTVSFFQIPKNT